ncbi:hypothetical protein KC19_11G037700 [Ceratodon purpureus]|uniref:Uncharacterized protein n=1 Tax=Ceratodon purpureus TaxID=3225 RepID=A0A8T0GDR1_CERPU|nr:hypothetical protein KC19_11G037700 [Ceratodon purpureus]
MASKGAQALADHQPATTPRLLKPAEKCKLIRKRKRDAPNKLPCSKRQEKSEVDSISLEDQLRALQLHDSAAGGNKVSCCKAFGQ